jgi:hypothetical protein
MDSLNRNFFRYELPHEKPFDYKNHLIFKICQDEKDGLKCEVILGIKEPKYISNNTSPTNILIHEFESINPNDKDKPFKILLEFFDIEEVDFTLKSLIIGDTCIEKQYDENPCGQNGMCTSDLPHSDSFRCICDNGWAGQRCDEMDSCLNQVSYLI